MKTKLEIYDITGKLVKTLASVTQSIGTKQIIWDKKDSSAIPYSRVFIFTG